VPWKTRIGREADFLLYLKNEPLFDGLRTDYRFQDIERRIEL